MLPPMAFQPKFVREAREAAGLTQKALADLAQLSPQTILNVEKGRVSPLVSVLDRIAKACRADTRDFFDD